MEMLKSYFEQMTKLPIAEWDYFLTLIEKKRIAKGKSLTVAEEKPKYAAFVINGLFRAYFHTSEGNEFVIRFCADGDLACDYAAILENRISYLTIQALEDSQVAKILIDDFLNLYARHSCWRIIGQKIAEQCYVKKEKRLINLLSMPAKKQLETFKKEHGAIFGRIPQKHIAGYLGISPISLNRLVRQAKMKR